MKKGEMSLGVLTMVSLLLVSPQARAQNPPQGAKMDPADIYQEVIDLHHRELLKKLGIQSGASLEKHGAPQQMKAKPETPIKASPAPIHLVGVYGDRAILRIHGSDVIVRRGSRVDGFHVSEIRDREVDLIPAEHGVVFLRRTGPAGLFRYRGRVLVRGVGDTIGPWTVSELGLDRAMLSNGSRSLALRPGTIPKPRHALAVTLTGVNRSTLTSDDFPSVPFRVIRIAGRHALLGFNRMEIEAGIGSTFGRWKILNIDEHSGVELLDRLTGQHIILGGSGGSPGSGSAGKPGGIPLGPPGSPSGGQAGVTPAVNPSAASFLPPSGSPVNPSQFVSPGFRPLMPGSGGVGPFQPPGGPQLPGGGY